MEGESELDSQIETPTDNGERVRHTHHCGGKLEVGTTKPAALFSSRVEEGEWPRRKSGEETLLIAPDRGMLNDRRRAKQIVGDKDGERAYGRHRPV